MCRPMKHARELWKSLLRTVPPIGFFALLAVALGAVPAKAQQLAYVTNSESASISVIDMANNMVVATITMGGGPHGVAFTPDGSSAFVCTGNTVSVIDTVTNKVVDTVHL